MKLKIALILILGLLLAETPVPVFAASKKTLTLNDLKGKILLQTESFGRLWYVEPQSLKRYYLKDAEMTAEVLKLVILGINNKDLAKIPTQKGKWADQKLVNRLKGKILLAVENKGELWYLNPENGLRYYLADSQSAFNFFKNRVLAVTNKELDQVPVNKKQIISDYTFNTVAHVKYDGRNFSKPYYADTILPTASLTKLMTALVLLDLKPDWQKIITITKEQINYPTLYVDEGQSSEIDLVAGDQMTFYDLWVAMLVASANQAAAALVDSTGLSLYNFIALMNQKTKDLDLNKTVFYDIAGLNSHNVSTAKEMAKIAKAAFDQPTLANSTIINNYVIKAKDLNGGEKIIKVVNRNYSLLKYQPQAAKTGFLTEAQRNVVLEKDGQLIVVLHALSMNQRNKIIELLLKP